MQIGKIIHSASKWRKLRSKKKPHVQVPALKQVYYFLYDIQLMRRGDMQHGASHAVVGNKANDKKFGFTTVVLFRRSQQV